MAYYLDRSRLEKSPGMDSLRPWTFFQSPDMSTINLINPS